MRGVGGKKSIEPGGFEEPQKQPACPGTVTMQLVEVGGDSASDGGGQIVKAWTCSPGSNGEPLKFHEQGSGMIWQLHCGETEAGRAVRRLLSCGRPDCPIKGFNLSLALLPGPSACPLDH